MTAFITITGCFGGILTAMAVSFSAPAMAQEITEADAVERLFTAEGIEADWLGAELRAQLPAPALEAIIDTLTTEYGAFVAVTGEGRELTLRLEDAALPTTATLDGDGRLIGLFFGPPVPVAGDLQALVDQIAALPGDSSVLVTTDGEVVAAHQPDLALGVGSAFKLLVLAALQRQIEDGERSWDDVVHLDAALRSLPSGFLQDWPAGTPMTLATLANLMISISDNTATDTLIAVVGRETLEAMSPRNAPFMATADMFRLKAEGAEEMAAAWIAGDEAERRAMLDDVAMRPLPSAEQFKTEPVPEIEWFMTATELCALLVETRELPVFEINPGLAQESDWTRVAFKGGSVAGFLNFSTLLEGEDGRTHCVIATWNDAEPLEEAPLVAAYAGILDRLAGGIGE